MIAAHAVRPPLRAGKVNVLRRRFTNGVVVVLAILATALVILPLMAILLYLLKQGVSSLNLAFFTQIPRPIGEPGGGMENAIVGSGIILLLASAIGIPVGIGAGIYLAEFGGSSTLGNIIRFTADVLNGVPSIVMGIAVYALIVLPQKHFSALAGGVVLGIMMVPTVTRTTEEMLRMVPSAIREAALGLGVPSWRSVLFITLRTASAGIVTGCMLAFARVAGETAPLLFTSSLVGDKLHADPRQALASVPLKIFEYSESPNPEDHAQAWAAAFVLIVFILAASLTARALASRSRRRMGLER
jgi:phosphate transport system permease protein